MLNLYLIRHAECEANTQPERIWGRSLASPLTTMGTYQAQALGQQLRQEGIHFDAVFCSPALRSQDTAKVACDHIQFPQSRIMISEWLHQRSQGLWEGRPREDVVAPDSLFRLGDWHFRPPQGETLQDVENRMYEWVHHNLADKQGNYALFTHDHAIKGLLRRLLNRHPHHALTMSCAPSSITQLQYDGEWKVVKLNHTPHLERLM